MIHYFCDASYSHLHPIIGIGIVELLHGEIQCYSLIYKLPSETSQPSIDAEMRAIYEAFALAQIRDEEEICVYTDCEAVFDRKNKFQIPDGLTVHFYRYDASTKSYLDIAHVKSRNYLHNDLYNQIPDSDSYFIEKHEHKFLLTTDTKIIELTYSNRYLTFLYNMVTCISEKFPFRPIVFSQELLQILNERYPLMSEGNRKKIEVIFRLL